MKDNRNPVVFRVHTGTGKVIALFPEEEVQPGKCLSFNLQAKPEVHQDILPYRSVIQRSRPATQSELQILLKEIRGMGLNPVIRQKFRRKKS